MKNAKPSILIAVPNLGNVRSELSIKFLEWSSDPRFKVKIWTPEHLIPLDHARNVIRREFLSGKFDFIMMCDADIVPPANILDLVSLDLDVVAPVSWVLKDEGIIPMALTKVEDGWQVVGDLQYNEIRSVDCAGAGCLIIARRVLEKVGIFRFVYDDDGMMMNDEGFDWNNRVIEAGFKIFVHGGYETSHFKTVDLKQLVKIQNNLRHLQERITKK